MFAVPEIAQILNIAEKDVVKELSTYSFQEKITTLHPKNRASYFETTLFMQGQLLKDSDTQSMWHSLELRVPFLDRDLMDFVNNVQVDIKFPKNSSVPKTLLVEAFKDILPEAIWNRPKKGFTFPFENWFQDMQVFQNATYMPQWVYQKFKKGDFNFSRLWSVFLSNSSKKLHTLSQLN